MSSLNVPLTYYTYSIIFIVCVRYSCSSFATFPSICRLESRSSGNAQALAHRRPDHKQSIRKNKSYKCVEKERRLHCARFKLPQNDMQSARESYRDGTRVWGIVVCISAGGADNRHTALRAHILCSLVLAAAMVCGWCSMHSFCRFVVCSSMSYLA